MWDGIGDFLAMGGHAPWVWGSYGAAAVLLVLEMVLLGRRRQRAYALLRRRARARQTAAVGHEAGGDA